jgi:mannose-1-phosphate guanylyltransferase
MLEETIARIDPLVPPQRVRIVTGSALAGPIREVAGVLRAEQIWVEPRGKNTAPAIGLAAALLAAQDEDAAMVLLPADHHIPDGAAFRRAVAYAERVARESGALVTFGIEPERAETGYGYIEVGELSGSEEGMRHHRVARFVEKPDQETAERYLEAGGFLWNSGIFVWRVRDILDALGTQEPSLVEPLAAVTAAAREGDPSAAIEHLFDLAPATSIDYAVMEKHPNVAVVRAPLAWDDVGAWSALDRVFSPDVDGNVLRGDVEIIDGHNNIVLAEGGVVALIGVEDLVVVRSDNATLVCRRERAQEVKSIVTRLKKRADGRNYL